MSQALRYPLVVDDVVQWDIQRMCQWLDSVGISEAKKHFEKEKIDGHKLMSYGFEVSKMKIKALKKKQQDLLKQHLTYFEQQLKDMANGKAPVSSSIKHRNDSNTSNSSVTTPTSPPAQQQHDEEVSDEEYENTDEIRHQNGCADNDGEDGEDYENTDDLRQQTSSSGGATTKSTAAPPLPQRSVSTRLTTAQQAQSDDETYELPTDDSKTAAKPSTDDENDVEYEDPTTVSEQPQAKQVQLAQDGDDMTYEDPAEMKTTGKQVPEEQDGVEYEDPTLISNTVVDQGDEYADLDEVSAASLPVHASLSGVPSVPSTQRRLPPPLPDGHSQQPEPAAATLGRNTGYAEINPTKRKGETNAPPAKPPNLPDARIPDISGMSTRSAAKPPPGAITGAPRIIACGQNTIQNIKQKLRPALPRAESREPDNKPTGPTETKVFPIKLRPTPGKPNIAPPGGDEPPTSPTKLPAERSLSSIESKLNARKLSASDDSENKVFPVKLRPVQTKVNSPPTTGVSEPQFNKGHSREEHNHPGSPPCKPDARPPAPGAPPSHVTDEVDPLSQYPWYFGTISRESATETVKKMNQEGAFLVRRSESGDESRPFTVCILHDGRVFNIKVRKKNDGTFALGEEKPREAVHSTVEDLVRFHRHNELEVSKASVPCGGVKLLASPPK